MEKLFDNYFFSGVVVAGVAFLLEEQQLDPFLASPQAALVFSSQPDLESLLTFSVFSAGFAVLSWVCGVWAKVKPAIRTTAENNKTIFFMVFGFISL